MSSLAKYYSSNLVGFFSYSREDDVDFNEVLSKFRNAIQAELSAQLGRNRDNFRIWQDRFAIPHGALWKKQITDGIQQSAFFIPIITPRMANSPHCAFEFESFLAREKELDRDDLIFPILYISVPELEDGTWKQSSVLKLVNDRQYLDWRDYRPRELSDFEVRKELIQFCRNIANALRKPWDGPEKRQPARIATEEARPRNAQIEAERLTEAQALETTRRTEDESQRRAAEASRITESKQRSKVAEAAAFSASKLPRVIIAGGGLLAGIVGLILALNQIGFFTGGHPSSPSVPVQGPSFDCNTDRKPVEQVICGDVELSSKDRALKDLYDKVLGGLSGQARTDLIQAEDIWLTKRNECHDPGMVACIMQSYDARIRELQAAAHH